MTSPGEIAPLPNRPRRGGALRAAAVRVTALLGAAPLLLLAASPAPAVVGAPAEGAGYGFTARLLVGDYQRGCSGSLISSEWMVTAASCFADDPAAGLSVPAGPPRLKTVATVGGGQTRDVVELVPHGDRDLVLARLAQPVTGVTPVGVAGAAPAVGQDLTVAGHGRTAQEWAPLAAHTGTFSVASVDGGDLVMQGSSGAAVCQGDAGGPVVRTVDGRPELVAVSSRSNQVGCFGVDAPEGTSSSAIGARVDDVRDWITAHAVQTPASDFDGDGRGDVGVLYDNGQQSDGANRTALWTFASTGIGFGAPVRKWDSTGTISWDWSRSKVVSGDFDGDGRADVGVLYDNGRQSNGVNRTTLWTFTSTGSGLGKPVKVWDNVADGGPSWDWSRSKVVSGDFDGDGRGDVGVLYDNGQQSDGANRTALWTFTSTGSGFGGPVRKWDSTGSISWDWGRSKVVSGDFDGDGRGDVGVLYDNGQQSDGANRTALWTFTSTGSGFGGPVRKWDSTGSISWDWGRSKVVSGDFDGDGRGDVGVLYDNGQQSDGANRTALWTFTSTGSGFGAPVRKWDSTGSISWMWSRSKVTSGDFDGDGRSDVAVLYDNGQQSDGAGRTALWTLTSTGSGFGAPVRKWDSTGTISWNWQRSELT
ncbi:trypsin-like serine protease [Streptomyces sp. CL12-4]|uniref:trypsin-like serine protease n=2 Tax=Streptomyces TaxID=1883 RepID=UPI001EFB707B|nr:trypsin-like serine protease [Streptomyces sp. CL12-4]MCG8968301.1 trypsin-like serine protease [Streptomyces sp. CL12-4]